MTYKQIMTDLEAGNFKPVYFLTGEESYFIDKISKYIEENALPPDQRGFNQTVLYGKETDVTTIDHAARRFPMMAPYQVLIVKEAQEVKKLTELKHYCAKPSAKTILVLNHKYKKIDKRTAFYKTLKKNAVVFESQRLYDNQIPDWITKYLKAAQFKIEPKATMLLVEFLGNDLNRIANELQKLVIPMDKGSTITPTDIERNIGISKEFNNFELQDAIGARDVLKANRIVDYFGKNPKDNPAILTIISLYGYFSKILLLKAMKDRSPKTVASKLRVHPFFVKKYLKTVQNYSGGKVVEIIGLLREYDLKLKGVGNQSATQGDLLKELTYKILH